MFAVIELQGHQYIVRENDTIIVDKLDLDGDNFVVNDVLLVSDEDGKDTTIGSPYVDDTSVTFSVVEAFTKGEKIRVLKFKRKNRYQRVIGHRSHQTILKVVSIGKATSRKSSIQKEDTKVKEKAVEEEQAVKKTATAKKPSPAKTTTTKKTATAKKPSTK